MGALGIASPLTHANVLEPNANDLRGYPVSQGNGDSPTLSGEGRVSIEKVMDLPNAKAAGGDLVFKGDLVVLAG